MGAQTGIEWTGSTWTPIRARDKATGKIGWHCEHKSEGCRNCYAEALNLRLGTGLPFKPGHRDDVELFVDETMLAAPLRWRKPRPIFVCSMTDLFADFMRDEWIDRIFAVMALAPQHTFQVLTKRPSRMRAYLAAPGRAAGVQLEAFPHHATAFQNGAAVFGNIAYRDGAWFIPWPLPNVWLGVSVEDQPTADARVPVLLDTPAAHRWVSYEPALGPVDWRTWLPATLPALDHAVSGPRGACLDAIVSGGESGPKARPSHPDWHRQTRDQCAAAGTRYGFKQWGEWREWDHDGPTEEIDNDSDTADAIHASAIRPGFLTRDGRFFARRDDLPPEVPCRLMERIGKRAAGRTLDGRTHEDWPG
ncbi:MAG: DUF5131 family protein [Vicinamibacterales bacterium]